VLLVSDLSHLRYSVENRILIKPVLECDCTFDTSYDIFCIDPAVLSYFYFIALYFDFIKIAFSKEVANLICGFMFDKY
jgi:hypothetical protein